MTPSPEECSRHCFDVFDNCPGGKKIAGDVTLASIHPLKLSSDLNLLIDRHVQDTN